MADTTCLLKYFEPYPSSSTRALKVSSQTSDRAFVGAIALLFALSAGLTIAWCGSMSAMGGMQMPGDWTMSMMWMRMPGQTWAGTMVSFVGMWMVMMIAMMLPSLTPMLWRYRKTVATVDELRIAGLTSLVRLLRRMDIVWVGHFPSRSAGCVT